MSDLTCVECGARCQPGHKCNPYNNPRINELTERIAELEQQLTAEKAARLKAESELAQCHVHCQNIDGGSSESEARYEIVNYGFAAFRDLVRGVKEAIPKTFYELLPLSKRVEYLVLSWNRAIKVNKEMENEIDHLLRTMGERNTQLQEAHQYLATEKAAREKAEEERDRLVDIANWHVDQFNIMRQQHDELSDVQGKLSSVMLKNVALRKERTEWQVAADRNRDAQIKEWARADAAERERDELATALSDAWEFIEDRASDYDDEGRAEFRAWVDGNVKSTPRAILAAHDAALVKPLVEALIQMRSLVRQLDYVDYELREAVTRLVDKALAAHKKGATE